MFPEYAKDKIVWVINNPYGKPKVYEQHIAVRSYQTQGRWTYVNIYYKNVSPAMILSIIVRGYCITPITLIP